jgi:hypothetical protein
MYVAVLEVVAVSVSVSVSVPASEVVFMSMPWSVSVLVSV